jgi:hypothetical protein
MLKTAREVLSLTDEQRAQLQRRLGEAYHKACVAFAPVRNGGLRGRPGLGDVSRVGAGHRNDRAARDACPECPAWTVQPGRHAGEQSDRDGRGIRTGHRGVHRRAVQGGDSGIKHEGGRLMACPFFIGLLPDKSCEYTRPRVSSAHGGRTRRAQPGDSNDEEDQPLR